jgi:hypothetical protein
MASGLETKRDFQVGLEIAWHKKTIVKDIVTIDDFPVIASERILRANGEPLKYGEKEFFVPISQDDNEPVSPPYCGGSFSLFAPRDGFKYVQDVLAGTDYTVHSLGMLKNRSKWFLSVYLDELEQAEKESKGMKFNLNFSGGMDGTLSPQAELSVTRQVCWNTVSLSRLNGQVVFASKLTKNFATRLEASKESVEKVCGMAKIFNLAYSKLENAKCTETKARNIYAGFLTPEGEKVTKTGENTVNELVSLFQRGDGNKGETLADTLNGFTQLRTRGRTDSKKDVWAQYESSEFGAYAEQKARFTEAMFSAPMRGELEKRGVFALANG